MTQPEPQVSVVIPAYNEERRLGKTLDLYLAFFDQKYGQNYEILVVLNGCRDNTEQVVRQYLRPDGRLRYLNFPAPIGKGGAIVEGYKVARGQLVAYSDADASAGPDMIDKLFEVLRTRVDVNCAIGSRNLSDSQTQGRTAFRKILAKGFNLVVNWLFGLGIRDTQCGAKALRRHLITQILPHLTISNLSFDVNLLFEVHRIGGKIVEVPIVWIDDHDSSIKKPIKTSMIMLLSVLRLRLLYSPVKRIYPIIRPISELLWKLLLTEQERQYMKIRRD